jgi:hypothetical protein
LAPLLPTPPADSSDNPFDLTGASPTPLKQRNSNKQASTSKRLQTDWKKVQLQQNTSGKTSLVEKYVRVEDYKTQETERKTEGEMKKEYGKSSEAIMKVSKSNTEAMQRCKAGDVATDIDLFAPFFLG